MEAAMIQKIGGSMDSLRKVLKGMDLHIDVCKVYQSSGNILISGKRRFELIDKDVEFCTTLKPTFLHHGVQYNGQVAVMGKLTVPLAVEFVDATGKWNTLSN